jgi:mannose-6-phosphate isomerase-like protein (cupin superfamily)
VGEVVEVGAHRFARPEDVGGRERRVVVARLGEEVAAEERARPRLVVRGRGRTRLGDREATWGPGDTLILPAGELHQLFADTDAEYIAVMPAETTITDGTGAVMDLPWRA